jgi:hypothetical protein
MSLELGQAEQTRIVYINERGNKCDVSAFAGCFLNNDAKAVRFAFDGVRWFVQTRQGKCFRPINESEVPTHVQAELR